MEDEISYEKRKTKCEECSKLFYKCGEYAYKFKSNEKMLFFCSWKCLREFEKEHPLIAKSSRMRN